MLFCRRKHDQERQRFKDRDTDSIRIRYEQQLAAFKKMEEDLKKAKNDVSRMARSLLVRKARWAASRQKTAEKVSEYGAAPLWLTCAVSCA